MRLSPFPTVCFYHWCYQSQQPNWPKLILLFSFRGTYIIWIKEMQVQLLLVSLNLMMTKLTKLLFQFKKIHILATVSNSINLLQSGHGHPVSHWSTTRSDAVYLMYIFLIAVWGFPIPCFGYEAAGLSF